MSGTVVSVKPAGGTPIPPGGAVLVARGTSAGRLASEAAVDQRVTCVSSCGRVGRGSRRGRRRPGDRPGRPAGFPVTRGFHERPALAPQPAGPPSGKRRTEASSSSRSTAGSRVQHRSHELRAGADDGPARRRDRERADAGGSTTMAFDGELLNRPSDPGGERAVADGYSSSTTASMRRRRQAVLSPNGDGVAESHR